MRTPTQKEIARDMLDRLYHDGKYSKLLTPIGDPILAVCIMQKFNCDSLEELRRWALSGEQNA